MLNAAKRSRLERRTGASRPAAAPAADIATIPRSSASAWGGRPSMTSARRRRRRGLSAASTMAEAGRSMSRAPSRYRRMATAVLPPFGEGGRERRYPLSGDDAKGHGSYIEEACAFVRRLEGGDAHGSLADPIHQGGNRP